MAWDWLWFQYRGKIVCFSVCVSARFLCVFSPCVFSVFFCLCSLCFLSLFSLCVFCLCVFCGFLSVFSVCVVCLCVFCLCVFSLCFLSVCFLSVFNVTSHLCSLFSEILQYWSCVYNVHAFRCFRDMYCLLALKVS